MGFGASLDRCGKSGPRQGSNPEPSAHTKLIKQVQQRNVTQTLP